MNKPEHLVKKIKEDYRLIAVSDIHGHLDYFKALLKKVGYDPERDYLVIIGDFVEKGDQVLETIEFVEELSRYPRCYVLAGNCEWALCAMLTTPELARHITTYLKRVSANGIIRTLYHEGHYDDGHETPLGMQREMEAKLHSPIQFMTHLPITLKLNQFIFVHAGLEDHDDYKQGSLSGYLEMQHFMDRGHPYKETVIVGHLPTSNYDPTRINNDIIINKEKRIISIDGGMGVKPIAQLNALIITQKNGQVKFSNEKFQPLPKARVIREVNAKSTSWHKIAFPDYEVRLIKKEVDFSLCERLSDHARLSIKNEFLYQRASHLYCLDDYTDRFLSLKEGDVVKIADDFGEYCYCVKESEVGWVKAEALKRL